MRQETKEALANAAVKAAFAIFLLIILVIGISAALAAADKTQDSGLLFLILLFK